MTLLIFQLVYLCNNNRWFKKVVERGRKKIKKKKKKGTSFPGESIVSRAAVFSLFFVSPFFRTQQFGSCQFRLAAWILFFLFFAAVYTPRGCKRRNSWRTCEVRHGRECINTRRDRRLQPSRLLLARKKRPANSCWAASTFPLYKVNYMADAR